jgi:hypothetical protein
MFRSGWGSKENQEVTLAIRLRREFFDSLLEVAVPSNFHGSGYTHEADWKRDVARSDVRLQWDPDHSPNGSNLERRAIQLGLRGDVLQQYADEAIVEIEDISSFVLEQRAYVLDGEIAKLHTPRERVYRPAKADVAVRLGLDEPTSTCP